MATRSRIKSSSNKRIGWTGVPRKEREVKEWERQFQEVAAYKRKHGHCNIPRRGSLSQRQLGTWVIEQRRRRRQGKMLPERFTRLEKIGFDWDRRKSRPDELWSVMYARMKEYKKTYGDCLVPQRFEDDIKLGRWVSMQRMRHNAGRLSKKREKLLDKIGFVWDAGEYLPPNIVKGKRRQARSAASKRKRIKKSRRTETQKLFSVGTFVMKYFDGDGWFLGEITSNTAGYRVVYEDGDREFYALDSERLMEMVDDARDVTADELLLDQDADEEDDTETEENYDDSEAEEENETEEEKEEEDDLFSRETFEGKEKEVEGELFATPDVKDEDSDEESDEEYASALEEEAEEENEEDELFPESDGDEEEVEMKEEEEEEQQPPQPALKQSRFSLLQNRVYSFFGSKTK